MPESTTMFIGIICILKGVIEYAAKNVYDNLHRAENNRRDKMKHQSENKRKKPPSLKLKKRVKQKRMLNVAAPCGLQEITGAGMNTKQSENDVADANNKLESFGSNISAEEIDFIQDSSDYQWFTDYNYRDNTSSIRPSILSSLSASYMYNHLDCYNDIARDIDVNLAQVDIEDFRAEDIHSLLHTLPQICNSDVQNEQHGEMYASVSGSLMVKYDFDSSLSHHSTSQEESNGSTGSFYKSEILFSPVKEVPLASFSTDSLDCDEHILLTCQANKDNYTIAFEGSTIMGGSIDTHSNTNEELMFSGSISQEGKSTAESSGKTSLNIASSESSNCAASSEKLLREISLHSSDGLVRSSSPYTTWSKLKENSSESIKKHSSHSSDSENAAATSSSTNSNLHAPPIATTSCVYLKSQSLPNLNPMKNYLIRHNKLLTASHPKNKNPFEVNTNHFDGRVKIYSLSNSDYRKKRYRFNCAAPGGTNLISRFINQKYTKNFNVPMNSSYNLQPNNSLINEHSYHPQSALQNKINFTAPHRCFEDSLVENATVNHTAESTIKYDTNATADEYTLYDSCSSFSSHTGKLVDTTNVSENKFGTTVTSTGKSTRHTAVNKVVKNNSFDSAMNIMKSDKKNRFSTEKHSISEPCPIRIMDRSIQTSLTINCEKNKATTETQSGETVVNTDKPVYVMYPNYTLPDLSFLLNHATELDLKNIFLWPQKFTPSPTTERDDSSLGDKLSSRTEQKKRPCSCPDLDSLKNKNYNHIRDWKSLMFLLPREYCQFLMQIPELENRFKGSSIGELGRSSLCTSGLQEKPLNLTESVNSATEPRVTCVSSSSTATQPSSGYRGSSTMLLTDSSAGSAPCSPFYMYKNDNRINCKAYDNESIKTAKSYGCERPPLPRGILRNTFLQNSRDNKQQSNNNKRYSMYELREGQQPPVEKRRSLPSHLASDGITRTKSRKEEFVCYSEDEGVESASSHCESPGPQIDQDARRLEQLLQENISWNEEDMAQLRDHVGHCLSQAGRKTVSFANLSHTPPNSPNSSVITGYKPYQMKLQPAFDIPIHEECESARHSYCDHSSSEQMHWTSSCSYKKDLMDSVDVAAHNLRSGFTEKQCDNDIAQTALMLCPALYAVLNHGLKPTLETPFGDINNSVWQVVEASSQQGPMTRALNELVLKLNSEDVLTEGLLKFNAFIFGLLNVRGLDTWFSYLRTRETILRKHYLDHSLLLSCSRGISSDRQLIDHLLSSLKPLTQYNFKLDLLYECRQLHTSLMQLGKNSPSNMAHNINSNNRTSWVLKKIVRSLQNVTGQSSADDNAAAEKSDQARPRSCVDSSSGFAFNDIASTVKKRWSGIQFGSKLVSAFERLGIDDEEEYTDSLENTVREININPEPSSPLNTDDPNELVSTATYTDSEDAVTEVDFPPHGLKFKELQRRWEMIADVSLNNSNDTHVNDDGESSNNFPSKISEISFTINKSRIPRPVTSPVRPPSLQFSVAPQSVAVTSTTAKKHSPLSPNSNIPMPVNRKMSTHNTSNLPKINISKSKSTSGATTRTSRIDQSSNSSTHIARPTSLSHRSPQKSASESKINALKKRPTSTSSRRSNSSQRFVRTLSHRLPSDNGHLSFNEGETLRVILDVDDKWILCCRGDQKGLVPRSAVLPISGHI